MNIIAELKSAKFIAIGRRIPKEKIAMCAGALLRAGGRFFEITFDPSDRNTLLDTMEKIRIVRRKYPALHVGCGTVMDVEMVNAAANAGAQYIVSPHLSLAVISETHRRGLVSIPGAYTPTEIVNAYEAGGDVVKIFPVRPGEESYVRNVMSPLSHIPFIVTGGVTPATIRAMLATGALAVAAGASIFPEGVLESTDGKEICKLAKQHLEAI